MLKDVHHELTFVENIWKCNTKRSMLVAWISVLNSNAKKKYQAEPGAELGAEPKVEFGI